MQKYADVVLDRKGNVVVGATVLVKTSAGANAVLYAENAINPISNPLITDNFGRFAFYAANGRYNLQVYIGSALLTTLNDVLLEDPLDASPEAIDGGTFRNGALENVTIDGKAPGYKQDTDALDVRIDALEEGVGSAGRWCGASATAPTTRINGSALQDGDEYQNTSTNLRYTWSGGAWGALNTVNKRFPFAFVAGQAQYDVGVISGDPSVTTTGLAVEVEGTLVYDFTLDPDHKKFTFNDISVFADGAQMAIMVNARFDDLIANFEDMQAGFAVENDANYQAEKTARTADYYTYLNGLQLESSVPYASGLSLVRPTQTVTQAGVLYRPLSTALPFTTTTWATDASKFVIANDMGLRGELAEPINPISGAAILGRGVVAIDGVTALLTQPQRTDLRFQMRGYHAGSTYGGSQVYWNATMPRSQHNGGTIFSPTVPWNGSTATLAAFLAGTGETAPAALGCFCRLGKIDVDSFGAVGGTFNDVASFLKCHEAGWPIILERPEYTISTLTTVSVKDFEISSPRFSKLNVSGLIDIRYKTRLKLNNVNYDFTLQDSSQVTGVFARDCQDLDVSRNTAAHPWKTAFSFWSCLRGSVYRNTIRDTGRGMQSNEVGVNLGCGVIVYGCNGLTVDHNFMYDIWQIPIFVTGNDGYECWDIVVSKNILDRNQDNGIRVQSDDVARIMVHDVSIEGNIVSSAKNDGIRYSGLRISVTDNIIDGCLSSGIDCQFADSCFIDSNIVRNCADGISMTAYDRMSDNNTISNNTIENCTGASSAIAITNVTGGSFGVLIITGNKIKTLETSGNHRGISVSMLTKAGTEDVLIDDNTVNGFYNYGVTVTNLAKVTVSGQKFAAMTTKTKDAYVNVTNCDLAIVTDNVSRGSYGTDPAIALRTGATVANLVLVNNILPHSTGDRAGAAATSAYEAGNVLGPVQDAAYSISGAGIGGTNRTLTNTSTLLNVINVLYTLVDDIAKNRNIHR